VTASSDREMSLERQIRLLCAGWDIAVDDPAAAVPQEAIDFAREGEKVRAVRTLRRRGFGLLAAKRIVDAIGSTRNH
jgi:hypothetical protein